MKKAAAFLGIGTDNVFIVKTDERYGWVIFSSRCQETSGSTYSASYITGVA